MSRPYTWSKGSTPPETRIMQRLLQEHGMLSGKVCWIWPGATRGREPHLYGCIKVGSRADGTRRTAQTHVVMWESINGLTPEGKELHHTCMTPLCCNPAHLTPVTHQENSTLVTPEISQARRERLAYGRAVKAAM